jgi:hypothetical protein
VNATIAVIIPTRNRASLARQAVRSLLDQDCPLEIFVSDNSTSPSPFLRLAAARRGVHYLRPYRELSVAEHWDWAIGEVMRRSSASHIAIHHDRRWSKRNAWGAVADVASRRPDLVLSINLDSVTSMPPPPRLWQAPWTGKTWMIRSSRAAALLAGGCLGKISHALPMLAGCIVPREVFLSLQRRFESFCLSTGPDLAFMAHCLATQESYAHVDRSIGVLHAADVSTTTAILRGRGHAMEEFVRLAGRDGWLHAAPVPGVNLGASMLFHEYELARRATGDRLPPLNRVACMEAIASALRWIEDHSMRESLAMILRDAGWEGDAPADDVAEDRPPFYPPEAFFDRLKLMLARLRGTAPPPNLHGFAFRSDQSALRYALKFPRPAQATHEHLELLEPVELSAA